MKGAKTRRDVVTGAADRDVLGERVAEIVSQVGFQNHVLLYVETDPAADADQIQALWLKSRVIQKNACSTMLTMLFAARWRRDLSPASHRYHGANECGTQHGETLHGFRFSPVIKVFPP